MIRSLRSLPAEFPAKAKGRKERRLCIDLNIFLDLFRKYGYKDFHSINFPKVPYVKYMSFKFSCFISYPHGQKDKLVPFITKFVKGLEDEIFLQSDKGVFVDSYLEGGVRLDEEIGPNLCQSACMILFFTPLYFATDHVYCARELLAMQELEKKRMEFLKDKGKGLIIPVVLRGETKFPEALKNTLYHNFTDIADPAKMLKMKSKEIQKIAQYILERCDDLDKISESDLPRNCEAFCLPDSDKARQFVEKVLGKAIVDVTVSFPSRSENQPTA